MSDQPPSVGSVWRSASGRLYVVQGSRIAHAAGWYVWVDGRSSPLAKKDWAKMRMTAEAAQEGKAVSEHPKYHIKTISDFLEIPLEKLKHALTDFKNWIAFAHAIQRVIKENPKSLKGLELDLSEFIWVDDGLHEIIPTFTPKETVEPEVKP